MEKLLEAFKMEDVHKCVELLAWLRDEGKTLAEYSFMDRNRFTLGIWATLFNIIKKLDSEGLNREDLDDYFEPFKKVYSLREQIFALRKGLIKCPDCGSDMKIQVWADQDNCGQWICGKCRRGVYFDNFDEEKKKYKLDEMGELSKQYSEELAKLKNL